MTRKIFVAVILVCVLTSVSWGAVSDDIYVRKDVYQSDMRNINDKLDLIIGELKEQQKAINELTKTVSTLSERIESVNKSLSEKIDGVNKSLNEKIDGVNKSLNAKIDGVSKTLTEKIDSVEKKLTEKINGVNNSLTEKIDGVENKLNEKINGVENKLSEKIDGVDKKLSARMDDLRNGIYLVLTLIALVVSLPFIRKWYDDYAKQRAEARKPAFTLEDVQNLMERLIAENNVMLLNKIQGGMN